MLNGFPNGATQKGREKTKASDLDSVRTIAKLGDEKRRVSAGGEMAEWLKALVC